MSLSTKLTQLALVGIASGMISAPALAEDMAGMNMPAKIDSAPKAKPAKRGNNSSHAKPAVKDTASATMQMDTSMTKAMAHDCKGHNECKGMGNCAVSEKDLKALAAKSNIPMAKAGEAHSCKGQNECKGLGGCKGGM